jgi:predicted glycoside hydrolase/deacetylase ChbG (UPF0249 family)
MSRLLIVNADDYGRSPGVSAGIRTAHNQGLVSTSTVMINMPGASAEVERALRESPRLGLGVHLNLTVGLPCAPTQDLPSLIDSKGRFKRKEALYQSPEQIDPTQVEIEWRAQIEAFLSAGAKLDHLDSHHHIASIRDAYPQPMLDFIQQEAMARLRSAERPSPDHFFASFFGPGASLEHLLTLLRQMPEGVCELMCHPGYVDDTLLTTSGYAQERQRELTVLTHPDALQIITQLDTQLCTYRDIWNPSPEGS